MSPTRRFRVDVRASHWGDTERQGTPVVRIYPKGGKGSIAIDYTEIPKLISDLATLLAEHQRKETT